MLGANDNFTVGPRVPPLGSHSPETGSPTLGRDPIGLFVLIRRYRQTKKPVAERSEAESSEEIRRGKENRGEDTKEKAVRVEDDV